jgi:plasmid stabilization system protein ParE
MLKLRWDPAAVQEAEAAVNYLTKQRPELGDRFCLELRDTIERIRDRPEMFSVLETLPDEDFRRALVLNFSYIVIFRICADQIAIVAVAHASREPNYWMTRSTGQ